MTYHKDGGPVSQSPGIVNVNQRNVGWLSKYRTFSTGNNISSSNILKALADKSKSAMMMGHHVCEMCGREDSNYGNGEIWILANKIYWRMPRMIWHYVESHDYKLPVDIDSAISENKYEMINVAVSLKGVTKELICVPTYEIIAEWNEIRYKNLIEFNKMTNSIGWWISETWVKEEKYGTKISLNEVMKIDYLLEDNPDHFPDLIKIIKK